MNLYPKKILTVQQQLQTYLDAGMIISSPDEAVTALTTIGYYRLRGYSFHLYDNTTKKYRPGTTDKKLFWQNLSSLSSEVARSNDMFIRHNFQKYEGEIPLWASVEIMSFGTLSKTIKNLKTGPGSAYSVLANYYRYLSPRGRPVSPSLQMLSSWIQSVSILRNLCAHNSRIYNRTINAFPELLISDQSNSSPRSNGLYQILLAMKYLRPSDSVWNTFYADLQSLFVKYQGYFDFRHLHFPADWHAHLTL